MASKKEKTEESFRESTAKCRHIFTRTKIGKGQENFFSQNPRDVIFFSNMSEERTPKIEKSFITSFHAPGGKGWHPWMERRRLKKLCVGAAVFSDVIISIWALITIYFTSEEIWLSALIAAFILGSIVLWPITLKRLSPERYTFALSIYAGIFILLIVETAVQSKLPLNPFTMGISFQLNLCLLFISRCKRIEGFLSTVFYFTYLLIRLGLVPRDILSLVLFLSLTLVLLITNCVFFHLLLKEMIMKDKEVNESQRSLESFKKLLKDVLPNAIMIIQDEEIMFANKAAESLKNHCTSGRSFEDDPALKREPQLDHIGLICNLQAILIEAETNVHGDTEFPISPLKNNDYEEKANANQNLLQFIRRREKRENYLYVDYNKFTSLQGSINIIDDKNTNKPEDIGEQENSKKKFFDIQVGDIFWEQKPATMIVLNDITDAKKVDMLKMAGHFKDQLLATVSHDLRTPLNGILGMLELSIDASDCEQNNKLLGTAMRAAKLLQFMINDILDFSLLSNGKLKLNKEEIPLKDILRDVVKLIKFQAKQKGIGFRMDKEKIMKSKIRLYTDANRVRQILLNLLGNALKFTEKGHIGIEVEEKHFQETDEKGLFITVEDTGIGIKPEDIPRLFKLFGKLEQRDSHINKTGIGLGLAISQNLTRVLSSKRSNGIITVESTYGKGTKFFLPLFFGQENKEMHETEGESMISPSPPYPSIIRHQMNELILSPKFSASFEPGQEKKPLVLIVDDDAINLMVASKYVKSYEVFDFEVARNGKEALSVITTSAQRGQFFDIVLMDCNMPFLNGYEATKRLVEMAKSGLLPLPHIIALTANTAASDIENCFRVGMHDYIYKPVKKSVLEKKMKDIVNKTQKWRHDLIKK